MRHRAILPILGMVLAAGCGSRIVPGGPDQDIRTDGPHPPPDFRIRDDRYRPPDQRPPHDWRPGDWYFMPDQAKCSYLIGTPCTSPSQCCGGQTCVTLPTGVSLCTHKCAPDDPSTPLVIEDSCPDLSKHVCAEVDPMGGSNFCLARCKPTLGQATCAAGIACRPESSQMSGDVTQALCAYPACKSGNDCPVVLAETCNLAAPVPPCGGSPPGAFCVPDSPWAMNGKCALGGACDKTSGLCAPHGLGQAGAKVGDMCKDDRDCAASMRCDQQSGGSSAIHARNGYCVIDGCAFASTLVQRQCPSGSACQYLFPGGRCFKTCDLQQASDCRGNPADKHGDYECYAWNNLVIGSTMVAKQPTCEPADPYPCNFWGTTSLDCTVLGQQGNPTQMACRQRSTGSVLSSQDPGGFCLDTTASGN